MSTQTNTQQVFKRFQWNKDGTERTVIPSGPAVRLANHVRDVSLGIGTIFELIEHDLITGDVKLLDHCQLSSLIRLGMAAASQLDTDADELDGWIEKFHMQRGETNHG